MPTSDYKYVLYQHRSQLENNVSSRLKSESILAKVNDINCYIPNIQKLV